MLPKKTRIPRSLFKNAIIGTRFVNSSYFTLRYKILSAREQTGGKNTKKRFAFVIPKTAAKKAVVRNKIRRRGYGIIRKNLSNIKEGVVCVFLAKKGAAGLDFDDLEKEIVGLLKKAYLL